MIYQLNDFILYREEIAGRIENNFINKFDILDKKSIIITQNFIK